MATAGICNTFDIVIQGADLLVAKTFTMPRAATVIAIEATNTVAGAGTLICSGATAGTFTATAAGAAGTGIVQAQAVGGPNMPVGVFATNATLLAGEVVTVTTNVATTTKVVLSCIGTSQALTVT